MPVAVTTILIIVGLVCVASAATLIGAIIAIIRPDHQNPIAHTFIHWHTHHAARR